ncbi:MAG: DUF4430 domain-containing protein, partial [Oscillospiraceae bacterium]|nr:DUF4430 domain-containing protein [Oscillospiraceae bacterium]
REPFVSSSEQTNLQGTYYEASNSTGRSGTEQDRQDSSEPSEAAGESEIPYASPADLELGTYSDSVASAEPNTSAEPGVPGAPNAPDTPDTPGETATSAHQEPTENPSDPITPDSPATPGNVTTPDVPASETQIAGGEHPEMREPVEPEDMIAGDGSFTVTLSVRAHMILYNMHLLHIDKHELVPADGWIFPPTQVTAYEGESVFNVLQREMRRNRIHMSSRFTPVFNSAYVEAINNLFEFDVGPLSGWMYSVNGWFPNFGASRYLLSPGDVIEWVYTVDLGRDLGVGWLTGTQEDE